MLTYTTTSCKLFFLSIFFFGFIRYTECQNDPLFSFSAHAASIARRGSSKLDLMRALSNTHYGKDKDCLILTYKCFILSVQLRRSNIPAIFSYFHWPTTECPEKVAPSRDRMSSRSIDQSFACQGDGTTGRQSYAPALGAVSCEVVKS